MLFLVKKIVRNYVLSNNEIEYISVIRFRRKENIDKYIHLLSSIRTNSVQGKDLKNYYDENQSNPRRALYKTWPSEATIGCWNYTLTNKLEFTKIFVFVNAHK